MPKAPAFNEVVSDFSPRVAPIVRWSTLESVYLSAPAFICPASAAADSASKLPEIMQVPPVIPVSAYLLSTEGADIRASYIYIYIFL